jgi:hypothetical protein
VGAICIFGPRSRPGSIGLTQRLHDLVLGLSRGAAQRVSGPHARARWRALAQAFPWSRVGAIAGSTSQVQACIIA